MSKGFNKRTVDNTWTDGLELITRSTYSPSIYMCSAYQAVFPSTHMNVLPTQLHLDVALRKRFPHFR